MLNHSFASLGLPTELVDALVEAGIDTPFPVQAATIPDALAGRDVLGRARTGSGKTLAFGLPLLTRLADAEPVRPKRPRALVLVPTRELALQVVDALHPMAKSLGLWCRAAVGGMSFVKQVDALRRGVDLLVATPGRLSDHVRQGTCELGDIAHVAIDEADQMADMGFLPQVRQILDLVKRDAQVLLFSATLDGDVDTLVKAYMNDPVTHSVVPPDTDVAAMEHHLLFVSKQDKPDVVAEMAAREGRTIMFVRTKHHVDRLADKLRSVGVSAGALHGGKTQGARNRVLSQFKDGNLPVLVATDVAARGIHVDGVSLVVHVDPPADSKDYLHRAGRTARAGESGTVVTVVTHDQRRTVLRLTDRAGVSPSSAKVRPGDEELARITGARTPSGIPVPEDVPPPSRGRRGDDRPRGDRRFGDRPSGGDRPRRFDDRPRYGDRPSGTDRPRRFEDRPRFGEDRPRRFEDRPRFGDDRPRRFEDRPASTDRPRRFDDRPASTDRPRRFEDRPAGTDRPRRFDDRTASTDRPRRFEDRPASADRPRRFEDRPASTDRPRRFEDRAPRDTFRGERTESTRDFRPDHTPRVEHAPRADDRAARKPRHSQVRHDRPVDTHASRKPRGWREGDRRSKTTR